MARSFFKKSKKVLLSVSLLTSLLFGVFALPLYTVHAEDFQLGLPDLDAWGEKLISSQYPDNIHNYYDMVWYGLYLQLQNYCSENNLPSITTSQVSQFFTSLSPSLALLLSSDGYDPSVLVNIYFGVQSNNRLDLLVETCPNSLLLDKPSYYVFDNTNISVFTGELPVFYPVSNKSQFTVLSKANNGGSLTFQFSGASSSLKSFVVSTSEHKFFAVYGLSLSDFSFQKGDYYSSGQSSSFIDYSVPSSYSSCLVHSFPTYTAFNGHANNGLAPSLFWNDYGPYLNLIFYSNNPFTSGVSHYFSLDSYIVYSEYVHTLYPSPTPYPTALPTVTPTPLPLAYDTDISGTNDALGYLSTLGEYFTNILSTWTVIPLLATTLGYVFHYSPWFGVALLVPTIALLSLLIGRNKS